MCFLLQIVTILGTPIVAMLGTYYVLRISFATKIFLGVSTYFLFSLHPFVLILFFALDMYVQIFKYNKVTVYVLLFSNDLFKLISVQTATFKCIGKIL